MQLYVYQPWLLFDMLVDQICQGTVLATAARVSALRGWKVYDFLFFSFCILICANHLRLQLYRLIKATHSTKLSVIIADSMALRKDAAESNDLTAPGLLDPLQ